MKRKACYIAVDNKTGLLFRLLWMLGMLPQLHDDETPPDEYNA